MKKKIVMSIAFLLVALLAGCGYNNNNGASPASGQADAADQEESGKTPLAEAPKEEASAEEIPEEAKAPEQTAPALADGTYTAQFHTDSSMFHVNEACGGKGELTVENGKMTIHISLVSKNIVSLYPGLAQDAAKEGAKLLSPTQDTVTYSDGMTEEVYGFDVPVPALDTEFDLAILGKKGEWYDHKVSVSGAEPLENEAGAPAEGTAPEEKETKSAMPEDGTYRVEISFAGGSGKAAILSPATLTVSAGKTTALVEWNSPNYDYMIVDGKKYLRSIRKEIPPLRSRSRHWIRRSPSSAIPWR